ncbi:protein tyrosine phosphatase [Cutibacterium sp. WCA-380-WT-3A]|uniref:Protein tyrosine phosphatase n=1 Tax=Cutibacterium porci TaxID=2605781 RepID=A0A7K0J4I1_9ACTN|nr:protein tyrosine phosphatase [Cutibacterium porci]MSS44839.1 protein tyrosine phosphatase [Cutibacterium porci]
MTSHTSTADMLQIHFICTANICRSAYCHARAFYLFDPSRFEVSSSGIQAEEGLPMCAQMHRELERRQPQVLPVSSHQTEIDDLEGADLILTMTASQRDTIVGWWPYIMKRAFTLPQFVEIARRLTWDDPSTAPQDVIDKAFRNRAVAGNTGDIKDPYRQGSEAARSCADTLDTLLMDLAHMLTPVSPRRAAE